MKLSRMTREQKDFFLDMDPFLMMDRLEFPNTFALIATKQEGGDDIPAGLMICSLHRHSLCVDWLCVSGNYRMQGVGELLLSQAFSMAASAQLETVCAYVNDEYGRELICGNQENYFKERLFEQEKELYGEWMTDLRTLARQEFFQRKPSPVQILPLRRLSTSLLRDDLLALQKMKETVSLYEITGLPENVDADVSCFLTDGEQVRGGLLVQCIRRTVFDGHTERTIAISEPVLYPVLFCATSMQDASTLLLSAMQAALAKYPGDTEVRIMLSTGLYQSFCNRILPKDQQFTNRLLLAKVSDYEKSSRREN